MIICNNCSIEIPTSYRSGLCTRCRKHYNYRKLNPNRKPQVAVSPEEKQIKKKKLCADYYKKNKDKILTYNKEYKKNNLDKIKETIYKWSKETDYYNTRYNNDLSFRIKRILRARLNRALNNNQKIGSAIKDLGCSIDEFRMYIESLWQEGMSWSNHSKDGWHIDHIIPLDYFNLSNPGELQIACNYTNLQPMWAKENLSKKNKLV